ncbi:hypothetical protein I3843_01G150600 [Carya illinoinensis]|nr:hypothetical protein I3843_01G150600 [Carya illinoinensis]
MRPTLFTPMASNASFPKPQKSSIPNSNPNPALCKHSPSATLDLLILVLVLFSCSFLLSSYFSYIFHSVSLLLSHFSPLLHHLSVPYLLSFLLFFAISAALADFCCGSRSRRCQNPACKGLKKAMEFDLQLQTDDCVKSPAKSKEIDGLPWKGGSEANPDYECLRSELRKMAPPNGRAVLLFHARCGCPVAKLEGWGPKRGKRHRKAVAVNGVGAGCHR